MNKPTKGICFGGGGGACALLPILTRLMDIVIVDGDNYEKANYSRQFPALTSTGNKAEVLAGMLRPNTTHKVEAIPKYLEGLSILNEPEMTGADILIGTVDNHASRHLIMELAAVLDIPAFLAGNEEAFGECHVFIPGVYDPCLHHDFSGGAPPPFSCNTDAAIEASGGQSALANALGSGALLHCLMSWNQASKPENVVVWSRLDPFSAIVKRAKDYQLADVLR